MDEDLNHIQKFDGTFKDEVLPEILAKNIKEVKENPETLEEDIKEFRKLILGLFLLACTVHFKSLGCPKLCQVSHVKHIEHCKKLSRDGHAVNSKHGISASLKVN